MLVQNEKSERTSLVGTLAIRLDPQAGKSLLIATTIDASKNYSNRPVTKQTSRHRCRLGETSGLSTGEPGCGRHGRATARRRLGHCFDGGRQAALMASGFVLVDDLLVSDAVQGAHRSLEYGCGGGFVTRFNGLDNLLDCGTQFGTQAAVVSILFNCLTSALTSLCCVCHDDPLIIGLR